MDLGVDPSDRDPSVPGVVEIKQKEREVKSYEQSQGFTHLHIFTPALETQTYSKSSGIVDT